MKRVVFILIAVLAFATVASAQIPTADVKLGKHDVLNFTDTQRQGCQSCHIPHAAKVNEYIWRWTIPTSVNGNGLPALNDVSFHTNACMSCHDGVTAAAILDLAAFSPTGGGLNVAADGLANDHPVDVMYTQHSSKAPTLSFTRLFVPSGYTLVQTTDPTTGLTLSGSELGFIECGSCHDPHKGQSYRFLRAPSGTYATSDFAKMTFCRDCHGK